MQPVVYGYQSLKNSALKQTGAMVMSLLLLVRATIVGQAVLIMFIQRKIVLQYLLLYKHPVVDLVEVEEVMVGAEEVVVVVEEIRHGGNIHVKRIPTKREESRLVMG